LHRRHGDAPFKAPADESFWAASLMATHSTGMSRARQFETGMGSCKTEGRNGNGFFFLVFVV
jgi:hypothetical protein